MSTKKPVYVANRFLQANRTPLAADNANVTNYDTANEFIVVFQVDEEAGTWTSTYTLMWKNVTDAGSYANIASTGEMKWGTSTDLTNGTAVTSKACTATGGAGSTWQNGEEVEGAATSDSIALLDEYYTEIHFAVSAADALAGKEYQFQLWENGGGSAVGEGTGTITILSPSNAYTYPDENDGGSDWLFPDSAETLADVTWTPYTPYLFADDEEFVFGEADGYRWTGHTIIPVTTGATFLSTEQETLAEWTYTPGTPSEGTDYLPETTGGYADFTEEAERTADLNLEGDAVGDFAASSALAVARYEVGDAVADFVADHSAALARYEVGDAVADFFADHDVVAQAVYVYSGDVAGDFAADSTLTVALQYAYVADTVGDFSASHDAVVGFAYEGDAYTFFDTVAEVTSTAAVAYYPETGVALSLESSGAWSSSPCLTGTTDAVFSVASDATYTQGESRYLWKDDDSFLFADDDGFIWRDGADWTVDQDQVSLVVAAAADVLSRSFYDLVPEVSATGSFAVGADFVIDASRALSHEGAVVGAFASSSAYGVGYMFAGGAVAGWTVATDSVLTGVGIAYAPEVGVSALLGLGTEYSGTGVITPVIEADATVYLIHPTWSTLNLVRSESSVPLHNWAADSTEFYSNIFVNATITGSVAAGLSVAEETLASYSIAFPALAFEGDVAAHLAVDRNYDRSTPVSAVGSFAAAGTHTFSLSPETAADVLFEAAADYSGPPLTEVVAGDVVYGAFSAGDWSIRSTDKALAVAVFGVGGAILIAYGTPPTTTWACESVPTTTWSCESVPSVSDTAESKPVLYETVDAVPTTSETVEGKPSTTFSDETKPTSSL